MLKIFYDFNKTLWRSKFSFNSILNSILRNVSNHKAFSRISFNSTIIT
nr:MAG TPA: hypothetical protein [Caudoviricetes sp.]DAK59246.1 MAG TPA: hypothetical protein [Caudoviricetes sp.]